jgi:suppressor for copper-sensitivity B
LVIAAALPSGGARAAASAWAETEHGAVRLITAADSVGPGERLPAGLHFRMKPGWKIYWRTPGDAGFPPHPDWAGSENLAEARLAWPAPERFDVQGLQTLGYKDEVVLPAALVPFEPGQAVRLRAKVAYLTCDDICVPYEATLALDLPAAGGPTKGIGALLPGIGAATTREAALIQRYAARVPAVAGGVITVTAAETTEVGSHGELRLRLGLAPPPAQIPVAQTLPPQADVDDAPASGAMDTPASEPAQMSTLASPQLPAPDSAAAEPALTPPQAAALTPPSKPAPSPDVRFQPAPIVVPGFTRPDAFVEGPASLSFGPPKVTLGEGARSAVLKIAVSAPPGKPLSLAGERVTVTVVDGTRAVERTVEVRRAAFPGSEGRASESVPEWLAILGIALFGGLILNLMPCVLPVLSIKLLSVLGHGGADPRSVRQGFLASAAGIVASFLALATAALALRATGRAAGWGLQFQEPAFLVGMTFILVLFAANLWGRFEIRLPGALADFAGTAGAGGGAAAPSLSGHFLTGAFATLLATPCSAPFLGTAVGFALARGPFEIYAVFAALGLGLALPYLMVAAVPRLVTALPRPGAWMKTLKRVLALALVATALWLLAVLAAQSGLVVAGLVLVMLVVAAAALWPLPEAGRRMRFASWLSVVALAVLAVGAVTALSGLNLGSASKDAGAKGSGKASASLWRPFDRDAIDRVVAAGKIVFVDVTADWCVTCKVNKALVLDREPVASRLAQPGIVAMRADWTRPDAAIAEYLKSFGCYGIPFDAVYGPGRPEGIALPELLSERAVLEALAAVAGTPAAPTPPAFEPPRVSRK